MVMMLCVYRNTSSILSPFSFLSLIRIFITEQFELSPALFQHVFLLRVSLASKLTINAAGKQEIVSVCLDADRVLAV